MKRLLLLIAVMQALFLSCSVKQNMELSADSSGVVSLNVSLHPIFRNYLIDISDILVENPNDQVLFDIETIKSTIADRKGLTLLAIDNPDRDTLELSVKFDDVENVVTKYEAEDVLTLTKIGGTNILDFHLTASNFRDLLTIAALDDSPLIEPFGPSATAPWDEDEYLENVSYALEEYGPLAEITAMFKDAEIDAAVTVKGKIISQKGGKISGDKVIFKIPLLRVLTLTSPLDLQIQYR